MVQSIPLVLVLWEHPNLGGIRRTIAEDLPRLADSSHEFRVSSLGVHIGPDYRSMPFTPTVSVFQEPDFRGVEAVLIAGTYCDLGPSGLSNCIRSVRFNQSERRSGIWRDGQFNGLVKQGIPDDLNDIPLIITLWEALRSGRR